LIQLYYRISTDPIEWTWIARMDHNETSALGHDVYHEGLHVDVDRQSKRTVHLKLAHSPLPSSRGDVIRRCVNYFKREAAYFIDVYEERRSPERPPSWSDGGEPSPRFIPSQRVVEGMSREAPPTLTSSRTRSLPSCSPRPRGGRLRRLSAVPPRSISLP